MRSPSRVSLVGWLIVVLLLTVGPVADRFEPGTARAADPPAGAAPAAAPDAQPAGSRLAAGPAWRPTGDLNAPRGLHTATLLSDGRVLVGGGTSGSPTASAELYTPATGNWSMTASLTTARFGHTATLLPNGHVLVVGGRGAGDRSLASVERYDPATVVWSVAAGLASARQFHTATLLPNGRVLVVGGFDGTDYLRSAELYDSATGTWSPAGSLATGRRNHTATLLPNGRVLVAGGFTSAGGLRTLASAELYDPTAGTWQATGSLADDRTNHTATLLLTGRVLVAGGESTNQNVLASAELYDPATGAWTTTGFLANRRSLHTASLLPTGRVLAAGGSADSGGAADPRGLASAELYDPAAGTWSATGDLNRRRVLHTATLLPDGQVLVAAGYDRGYLRSAELGGSRTPIPTATPVVPELPPLWLFGSGLLALGWLAAPRIRSRVRRGTRHDGG